MLPLILRGNQRGLLEWDSASNHRKKMKNFLVNRIVDQIKIPAGMTALSADLRYCNKVAIQGSFTH